MAIPNIFGGPASTQPYGSDFRDQALTYVNRNLQGQIKAGNLAAQDATARFGTALGGVQAGIMRGYGQQVADAAGRGAAQVGISAADARMKDRQFNLGLQANMLNSLLGRQHEFGMQKARIDYDREQLMMAKRAAQQQGLWDMAGAIIKGGSYLGGRLSGSDDGGMLYNTFLAAGK